MNTKLCPTCKTPISANAPGGFCPACILRDADELLPLGRTAPSLEDVRAAFPQLEVEALIGQGGMGFVYKARQPSLDRTVALKILSPELGRDPAFAERFAREARVLGKLNHPNIVTVFEHGSSQSFFYLLMEHVDGVNLRQAMRAGRFTPAQALAVVPGICDALQAAHAQGVWHRDIKPENILLDAQGGVKIVDFGIARIVGDPQRDFTLTMTGAALGSAAYMAPEQHESPHDVDHRADIYSLGVVIYEMLTGELPLGRFKAPSAKSAVDARIDEIVFRTLEKERELRQQSAAEVKTDVFNAASAPTATSSDSTIRPEKQWILPVALTLGGGVLAAIGWGILVNFQYGEAQAVAAILLAIGGVAFVLGFAGMLWGFYQMKRGTMSEEGRTALRSLATLLTVIVAWAAVAHAVNHPRDEIALPMGIAAVPLAAFGIYRLWRGNSAGHTQTPSSMPDSAAPAPITKSSVVLFFAGLAVALAGLLNYNNAPLVPVHMSGLEMRPVLLPDPFARTLGTLLMAGGGVAALAGWAGMIYALWQMREGQISPCWQRIVKALVMLPIIAGPLIAVLYASRRHTGLTVVGGIFLLLIATLVVFVIRRFSRAESGSNVFIVIASLSLAAIGYAAGTNAVDRHGSLADVAAGIVIVNLCGFGLHRLWRTVGHGRTAIVITSLITVGLLVAVSARNHAQTTAEQQRRVTEAAERNRDVAAKLAKELPQTADEFVARLEAASRNLENPPPGIQGIQPPSTAEPLPPPLASPKPTIPIHAAEQQRPAEPAATPSVRTGSLITSEKVVNGVSTVEKKFVTDTGEEFPSLEAANLAGQQKANPPVPAMQPVAPTIRPPFPPSVGIPAPTVALHDQIGSAEPASLIYKMNELANAMNADEFRMYLPAKNRPNSQGIQSLQPPSDEDVSKHMRVLAGKIVGVWDGFPSLPRDGRNARVRPPLPAQLSVSSSDFALAGGPAAILMDGPEEQYGLELERADGSCEFFSVVFRWQKAGRAFARMEHLPYVAKARVEFLPAQGDPKAILSDMASDEQVTQVFSNGVAVAGRFDIRSPYTRSSDVAVKSVSEFIERMTAELKKAGSEDTLKIISPATPPEKPAIFSYPNVRPFVRKPEQPRGNSQIPAQAPGSAKPVPAGNTPAATTPMRIHFLPGNRLEVDGKAATADEVIARLKQPNNGKLKWRFEVETEAGVEARFIADVLQKMKSVGAKFDEDVMAILRDSMKGDEVKQPAPPVSAKVPAALKVSIFAEERIELDGKPISLDDLAARLKPLAASETGTKVSVTVEKDASLEHVLRVNDAMRKAGVNLELGVADKLLKALSYSILGQVNKPGQMVLPAEPITVSKAVALAGGATRLAALEKVQVLRTDAAGVKKTITVDVKKALEGKATKEEDPVVLPGDQITVHESHF